MSGVPHCGGSEVVAVKVKGGGGTECSVPGAGSSSMRRRRFGGKGFSMDARRMQVFIKVELYATTREYSQILRGRLVASGR